MGVVQNSDSVPASPFRLSVSGMSVSDKSVSMSERSMSDSEDEMLSSVSNHTSYCVSTMQIPTVETCSVSVSLYIAQITPTIVYPPWWRHGESIYSSNHTPILTYSLACLAVVLCYNFFCLQKDDKVCLEDMEIRRELLHRLVEQVRDMMNDCDSIKRYLHEERREGGREDRVCKKALCSAIYCVCRCADIAERL